MRRPDVACVLLLVLFPLSMSTAAAQEKRVPPVGEAARISFANGDKVAVVVGVGAYPELSGLSRLDYPAEDAKALAQVLKAQGYTVNVLTDANALRGTVARALQAAAAAVDAADGTLLFYFSGHGFAGGGVNYLATYDTNTDELQATALGFEKVKELLGRSPAKRKVVLLDACRNDTGRGAKSAGLRSFVEFKQAEGLRILFSTKVGSYSYEDKELHHGIFTHFVIDGLSGKAAGEDGYITFEDLKGFVQRNVKLYALERGWSQIPFDAGEATGEFLLGRLDQLVGTRHADNAPLPPVVSTRPAASETHVPSVDALSIRGVDPQSVVTFLNTFVASLDQSDDVAAAAPVMGQRADNLLAKTAGGQSDGKNTGFKFSPRFGDGVLLSLPWNFYSASTARDFCREIGVRPCSIMAHDREKNRLLYFHVNAGGQESGTPFALIRGEAILVRAHAADGSMQIIGSHDRSAAVRLRTGAGGNWISLPYHQTATKTDDLFEVIPALRWVAWFEGGRFQAIERGSGTTRALDVGMGVILWVDRDTDWIPAHR